MPTLAIMFTMTTYGTWLRGDQRGWVDEGTIFPPNPTLESTDRARMKHPEFLFPKDRLLDRDRTLGTDVIAALRAAHPALLLMLVSDRPTAQSEAVALGAIKGFGKSALDSPDTTSLLRSILSPS